MPLSIVLVRPDLDVLTPGQHNGTFRGNNLAFVAGTAALEMWRKPAFEAGIHERAARVNSCLTDVVARYPEQDAHVRGRGLLSGIGWKNPTIAGRVSKEAYSRGLIVETSGAHNQVLKLMPPLTIALPELDAGLAIIEAAVASVVAPHCRQTIVDRDDANVAM